MKKVTVNDRMQTGYEYVLTEPVGKNFSSEFKPHLTPQEMLELGVFGGKYMTDCLDEFPSSWFKHAKLAQPAVAGIEWPKKRDKKLNYFGVNASQPLSVWLAKGWIHPDDPRGWFQWYCRYYMGRRHDDDERQIKRWKAMVRHVAQVVNSCRAHDYTCHTKQRQALLHWAYDSRKL